MIVSKFEAIYLAFYFLITFFSSYHESENIFFFTLPVVLLGQ